MRRRFRFTGGGTAPVEPDARSASPRPIVLLRSGGSAPLRAQPSGIRGPAIPAHGTIVLPMRCETRISVKLAASTMVAMAFTSGVTPKRIMA